MIVLQPFIIRKMPRRVKEFQEVAELQCCSVAVLQKPDRKGGLDAHQGRSLTVREGLMLTRAEA